MRNLFFILSLVLLTSTVIAQPSNVVNAYSYLSNNELDKAKEAIDKAVVHEKTSVKSKTWKFSGDIYYALLSTQKPNYRDLHENPGKVSFESYKMALKLDQEGPYVSEIEGKLRIIQNVLLNNGVALFNERNYDLAFELFETSVNIAGHFNQNDSLAMFNCALASERGGKADQAISWYKKCMDIDYRGADCCGFIIFILQQEGRLEELNTQIQTCRAKYPDNQNLVINELNFFLGQGQHDKAEQSLKEAIQNDPNNPVLHFSLGTIYENLGKLEESKSSYEKALELNPDYFDANYNFGAWYFNQGVEINNRANDIVDNAEYEKVKKEADEMFKKGLTYLEKAHSLRKDDINTMNSLKALYARLGLMDQYTRVKELLGQ